MSRQNAKNFQFKTIQLFVEKIKNNYTIALPVNGIFYLVNKISLENKLKLQQITCQENLKYLEILFKDKEQVLEYTSKVPSYANFFVKSIWPNPIALVLNIGDLLKGFGEQKIICHLNTDPQIYSLLEAVQSPLLITPAVVGNLPPAIRLEMLDRYYENQEIEVFIPENFSYDLQIVPTLLDCSFEEKAEILQPGPVSFVEIRKVLPKFVALKNNWNLKETNFNQQVFTQETEENIPKNFLKLFFSQTPQQKHSNQVNIVLGTKESLKEFQNQNLTFFNQNFFPEKKIFINIGSRTNPEGVVRNLYLNFFKASQLGQKIFLINNSWKNPKWGEILNFHFHKYSV